MPLVRLATVILLALVPAGTVTRALIGAMHRSADKSLAMSVGGAVTPDTRPGNCRVTLPADGRFVPPSPFPAEPDGTGVFAFWFGTEKLWTVLPVDGIWELGHYTPSDASYRQKLFLWRDGYNWRAEPHPHLRVTGRRLDGQAPPLVARVSNGYRDGKSFMVVGMDIPTLGCWEITGNYDAQELTFVVWVAK
jgi:hypothetical protein